MAKASLELRGIEVPRFQPVAWRKMLEAARFHGFQHVEKHESWFERCSPLGKWSALGLFQKLFDGSLGASALG